MKLTDPISAAAAGVSGGGGELDIENKDISRTTKFIYFSLFLRSFYIHWWKKGFQVKLDIFVEDLFFFLFLFIFERAMKK